MRLNATRTETSIGLDVGGTRIRAARITADGVMQGRIVEPVVPDRAGFAAQVLRLISQVGDATSVAVGIGIPGRVAPVSGDILSVGYLDIAGLDLVALVRADTGLACRVENDAMMALIAEGRGSTGLIAMITIGTGVGGAILRDAAPFHGTGFAGQFGHIAVAADGPLCNCGRRGCIESFSSGTALGALVQAAGLPVGTTAATLLTAAAKGDRQAQNILSAWGKPMKAALQTLLAVVDPAQVILGGGLGGDMARVLQEDGTGLTGSAWFDRPVTAARLGDDAGVIGAGLAGFMAVRT